MGRKSIGWKNLWSLTVLVFLRLKPMHPYELQSIIRITHKDDFLQLNPGSLYNSIERLLQAGLIEVAETTRSGRRPERTIYRLTAQGWTEAKKWLLELLETPAPDPIWFFAALSFLPAIPPPEAVEQLAKRVVNLKREIGNYRFALRTVAPRVGRLNLIEVEYALALRNAEVRWVKAIIAELKTGKLKWDPEMVRKHAAHFFTTCLPAHNLEHSCNVAYE
jgi:DNA-binding PadR family transcriptional regulator